MSKFCCITDLIRFMMKEAENLIKGSVHEEDFFIFHDALVLMTAKETIESIMDDKEIVFMNRPFYQVLCFLHHKPDQISDTAEFRHGG